MDNSEKDLQQWVAEAQEGDKNALENLLKAVQDSTYHLAMRVLADPEDALEATQEILILLTTKLSTFRSESSFRTWVYRVACNYLLTARKSLARERQLRFEDFREDLLSGLSEPEAESAEQAVFLNQLRISCTLALLLCLDIKHRLAYVLGDVLELEHEEAAFALAVSKANFRQRLSRARRDIVSFSGAHCGLSNESAACSCPRRLNTAIKLGRVSAKAAAALPADAPDYHQLKAQAVHLETELRVIKLQRATGQFACPQSLATHITQLISSR